MKYIRKWNEVKDLFVSERTRETLKCALSMLFGRVLMTLVEQAIEQLSDWTLCSPDLFRSANFLASKDNFSHINSTRLSFAI